jgi:hypothetical protein
MGLRFRKTVKMLPGVRLNISRSGTGLSIGKPRSSVSIGKRGVQATVGIPGRGVSYSEQISYVAPSSARRSMVAFLWILSWAFLLVLVFAAFGLIALIAG